jgi:pimeloyl-ACP methyl ester carboxylesterase
VVDDAVEWALDGDPEAMIAEALTDLVPPCPADADAAEALARAVHCPMLLIHGTDDRCQPPDRARRLSELTGAPLVVVRGAGHMLPARHPVLVNLLIRNFIESARRGVPWRP